jgi:hypothetical protein
MIDGQRQERAMRAILLAAGLAALMGSAALADVIVGSYSAYIGEEDLYNSKGERLMLPWQVLRQDRANFWKFGIRQPGDEADPFFSSVENRAAMELMVKRGTIHPRAARDLLRGGATVYVTIWGRKGKGYSVDVSVSR